MKTGNLFKLQKQLQKKLGNDLVYSVALDDDKYVLAISVHKSKRVMFKHGRPIQSAYLAVEDLHKDIGEVYKKLVELYDGVIVPREPVSATFDEFEMPVPIVGHIKD